MNKDFDRTLSDMVKKDYRTADVFKKWQLNFCCGADMSLKNLCETKKLDFKMVVKDLEVATRDIRIPSQLHFEEWKIDFLIDFIQHVHHAYIYQVFPALKEALEKFSVGHIHKFPELSVTTGLINRIFKKLMALSRQEDEVTFPYIKQMYAAHKRHEVYGNLFVRTLRKPLDAVEKEQLEISDLLAALKLQIRPFDPSAKICSGYQVIISKLQELCDNLTQHQYLERTILFPKAIEIEQNLLQM